MPRYLLSVHSVEGEVREPMTDEDMQQSWRQVQVLEQELQSAGAWVFSGRLHDPDTATVVRSSGGEVVTTDGPFVEAKEHLGSFYVIQTPIEVRPFAECADEPQAWDAPGPDARATLTPQPSSTRPRSAGSSARSPADRWPP
jgi:hypothetical protein